MGSHPARSLRILVLLVLWILVLSLWIAEPQTAYSSEPPERTDPTEPQTESGEPPAGVDWSSGLVSRIEPALLKQVVDGTPGDHFRVVVELNQQTDLAALPDGLSRMDSQRWLVTELQSTAEREQAELLTFLQAQQARGQVQQVRSFWIFNGLAVTADADTLLALASQPQVHIIREDRWRQWVKPLAVQDGAPQLEATDVEWNLSKVRADLVWSALGLDGNGATVAIMDTGVDWQHPALQSQYRGYKPGGLTVHQGNWACTTDEGYVYPVDGNGHGTHVAGTAVGSSDATGRAIGVAPGARWIAVKPLNDAGYGYDSWLHAAFEWLIAPAGDPSLAPDIVNASWGSTDDTDETFRSDLQALRAAGIVPVFSAGNSGPRSSSLNSPASYPEAIAVGATDDLDQATSSSSRGPSPWQEIKPEVVAPGAQIRSSLPGGSFGTYGGTSMAAPHVSGLVALLLQANPSLTVDAIEAIMASTAQPMGEMVPNNDSGWGRIDAYHAAAVALEAGFVNGQVTRSPDQQPLPTAQIAAYNHVGEPLATVQVEANGHYQLALPAGRYDLEAKAFGYEPQILRDVVVQANLTTSLNIQLAPSPAGVLWGQVLNAETQGPVSARIEVDGTPAVTTSDPQTGRYSIALPAGIYVVQASQNGYRHSTVSDVEIIVDQSTRRDMALTPAPTLLLVDSGRWYYGSQVSYFEQALADHDYVYDLLEIRDLETDLPSLEDLSRYEVTIWSSPQDAPGLIGAGDTISNYLSAGGNLMLTGQDVGYWDDGLSGLTWHEYYYRFLKARALADDGGRDNLVGLPGEILDGLSLAINGPESAGNQYAPDVIGLVDPLRAAMIGRYAEHGDAALRVSGCQSYHAVYLAAGLEGLGSRAERAEVLDRTLAWLVTPHPGVAIELDPTRKEEVWLAGTTITHTVELRNAGRTTDRFALELSPSAWSSSLWDGTFTQQITQSMALGTCQTQTLGIEVAVPPEVAWNVTDVVTLTARSESDPARTAQAVFQSKAPAPILLVDGHRWYDTKGSYEAALDANRLPYDVWTVDPGRLNHIPSVSLQRLQRYPVTVWFTAYDWFRTLTPEDEIQLASYLNEGGRLLLSSQDYLYTSGFTDFARRYLGVTNYTESFTATQVLGSIASPTGSRLGPYDLMYPFQNWSDALRPNRDSQKAFWGQHGQPVALTLEQTPWKTAFFAFPLEALQAQDMAMVLGRAVDWLSPLGDSSISVDRSVAAAGDEVDFALLIRNNGSQVLNHVSLSNTVPASTTYVAGSLQGPAYYNPATNRFAWAGSMNPAQVITVSYRLQMEPDLPDGTEIRNRASLSDESGFVLDRLVSVRINTPDLSPSVKTASAQETGPGEVLTYSLTLRNDGPQPAQAQLRDPIPLYTKPLPDLAWASSGLLTQTAEQLTWNGSISPGHTVTITYPVVISPTADGLFILNRATLDDGWGNVRSLEASTWVEARMFLPLVFKQR